MWVLGKIRESMENIPLELNRYMGKNEEDMLFPSNTCLSQNLHINIITPHNIPEFCLPPRLCKRNPPPEVVETPQCFQNQHQKPKILLPLNTTQVRIKDKKTGKEDTLALTKATKKPMPFSAECYGLAGMRESPNTRRKESLFHGKCPGYTFERRFPSSPSKSGKEKNPPTKSTSGILSTCSCKNLSETINTDGDTYSRDSSPVNSPCGVKSSQSPSRSGRLKGAVSCPSLINIKDIKGKRTKGCGGSITSTCSPPSSGENSLTLCPPVLFPLDILRCQERLQREHVLPLQGRGRVRLSAEHTTISNNTSSAVSTVRVRVVSVEGLSGQSDHQTLNCAVSLCLTPGKLQQQESATIKNCRIPVFNEDFFFTELTDKDLMELQLKLKVVDKPSTGTLRSRTVIGVICKPLSQLLPVKKNVM